MFTREQYLNAVKHEVNVLKHLYTKLPKDKLEYRPTPKQRSLQELLDFLPGNLAILKHMLDGDWKNAGKTLGDVREAAHKDFNGTLDREFAKFAETVNSFSDTDITKKDVFLPTGQTVKLGDGLLGFPLKFITAYKMQLFLYLKSCGREELNTFNCWFGMDGQMPQAQK